MSFQIERMQADRVGPPQIPLERKQPPAVEQPQKPSFSEHLQKACEDIGCRTQFSQHARVRVDDRSISLQPEQLVRIDRAVDSIAEKGADKALVMLDDMAFLVGVEKRTIITVVDGEALKDNVFTSIDAAVIA